MIQALLHLPVAICANNYSSVVMQNRSMSRQYHHGKNQKGRHFQPKELLARYSKSVWFPKLKNRDWKFKTLTTLAVTIKSTLDDNLISLNTTILDFDDLRLKYESCLVDSINSEIFKKPALSQSLFAISGTASNKGQSVWMKDPFKRNNRLDQERLALSQASKQTYKRLMEFLGESALYYCNRIFEVSVVSLITKSFL